MIKNGMRPVHPGEVLREDYLKPLKLSANALSKALHVPAGRVNDIVLGRRGVTPDTALRLARFFGGDAQSWLNLQLMFDLKTAELEKAQQIEVEVEPLLQAASARIRNALGTRCINSVLLGASAVLIVNRANWGQTPLILTNPN